MILYTFTDRKHLDACKTSGIEHGVIPYTLKPQKPKGVSLHTWPCYQWLTNVSEFYDLDGKEGPKKSAVLLGRKSEFRLKVNIPYYGRSRLRAWEDFARRWEIPLRWQIWLDLGGKPDQWWIYAGVIPSKWILEVARNPSYPDWVPPEAKPQELAMDNTGLGRGEHHAGLAQPLI